MEKVKNEYDREKGKHIGDQQDQRKYGMYRETQDTEKRRFMDDIDKN